MLGDDDPAIDVLEDCLASLGADVGEPRSGQGLNHLAEGNVGEGRTHAVVAIWNDVTNSVDSIAGCSV